MATNFTMPSMFDTRYAMDRQMELDAQCDQLPMMVQRNSLHLGEE